MLGVALGAAEGGGGGGGEEDASSFLQTCRLESGNRVEPGVVWSTRAVGLEMMGRMAARGLADRSRRNRGTRRRRRRTATAGTIKQRCSGLGSRRQSAPPSRSGLRPAGPQPLGLWPSRIGSAAQWRIVGPAGEPRGESAREAGEARAARPPGSGATRKRALREAALRPARAALRQRRPDCGTCAALCALRNKSARPAPFVRAISARRQTNKAWLCSLSAEFASLGLASCKFGAA